MGFQWSTPASRSIPDMPSQGGQTDGLRHVVDPPVAEPRYFSSSLFHQIY